MPLSQEACGMTEIEYARKVAEIDRLLNDPDVPMQPSEVWALLDEISRHDLQPQQAQQAA
jgi:hypothetical protein